MNTVGGGNVPRRFAKKFASAGLEVGHHPTIAKRRPSIIRTLFEADFRFIGNTEATINP
ncbi:hypothetical protein [Primorskyibacter marinus]|uniref:hypothetical protein n=1 Tax=Primorskyibacter marinus TaxID=1977320 RepID=UPI0013004D46|nr:hypothetical protein [Primorskyibacter marinus]